MKFFHSSSSSSPYIFLTTTILLLTLLFLNSHVNASNSAIDNFLQCLPRYSNALYPISNAVYSRESTNSLSFLQFYIGNHRLNETSSTSKYTIETLEKNYVQAIIVCARVTGLKILINGGDRDFEGLSYVSDSPLIHLWYREFVCVVLIFIWRNWMILRKQVNRVQNVRKDWNCRYLRMLGTKMWVICSVKELVVSFLFRPIDFEYNCMNAIL